MNVISILIFLVVVGVFLYIVETLLPIDGRIKKVIQIVALLAVFLYLLQAVGVLHGPAIYVR